MHCYNKLIFFKFQDCGMVLEEQQTKIFEALRLFLQGNGYGICCLSLHQQCTTLSSNGFG